MGRLLQWIVERQRSFKFLLFCFFNDKLPFSVVPSERMLADMLVIMGPVCDAGLIYSPFCAID